MSEPHLWEALLLLALVALSAVFTAAETAMTCLSGTAIQRISERGRRRAWLMSLWEEQPDRIMAALMVGHVSVTVAAAILAADLALIAAGGPEADRRRALACAAGIVAPVLLLLGHMVPRLIARGRAEAIAHHTAGPVRALVWMTAPVTWVLSRMAYRLAYAIGGRPSLSAPAVTEEEMKALVEAGVEDGAIEQGERKLIHSIFEFADTTVREVMVPRVDMVCVEAGAPMEEILEIFAERRFSRMPVYDETVDNVVGIVHIKNILNFWRRRVADMKAMEFVSFPHFIPETKKVIELLEELRQSRQHMAIVVDEYGGTAGLVTMEDLIEEIVGEIEDEQDRASLPFRKSEDGSYLADARVEIDRLNEMLSLRLPKGEFETLGGLLYDRFGKIPSRGEQVELGGVRITVMEGDARRIRRVKLELMSGEDPATGGADG